MTERAHLRAPVIALARGGHALQGQWSLERSLLTGPEALAFCMTVVGKVCGIRWLGYPPRVCRCGWASARGACSQFFSRQQCFRRTRQSSCWRRRFQLLNHARRVRTIKQPPPPLRVGQVKPLDKIHSGGARKDFPPTGPQDYVQRDCEGGHNIADIRLDNSREDRWHHASRRPAAGIRPLRERRANLRWAATRPKISSKTSGLTGPRYILFGTRRMNASSTSSAWACRLVEKIRMRFKRNLKREAVNKGTGSRSRCPVASSIG